jgi:hypothetical protein
MKRYNRETKIQLNCEETIVKLTNKIQNYEKTTVKLDSSSVGKVIIKNRSLIRILIKILVENMSLKCKEIV